MLKIFLSMIMVVCCAVSVDAKQNKDEVKVPAKVSGGASRDALQTSNKNNKGGLEFSERLKKLSDTELERRIALVEKMIKAHPEGASSNGKARKLYKQLEAAQAALLNEQSRRRSSFLSDHKWKMLFALFVLLGKAVEKVLGWIKKGKQEDDGNAE